MVRVPSRDVAGSDISGLPRYPSSVRVRYERGRQGRLETLHASYLTRDRLDAVRGYYREVFRAEGWDVANADYREDAWTFLVLHGEREANIEIYAREAGVTGVDVELSEPAEDPAIADTAGRGPKGRPSG